jgi:hypothetical protein
MSAPSFTVEDALLALEDQVSERFLGIKLATLKLDAELVTAAQRFALADLIYELADAILAAGRTS